MLNALLRVALSRHSPLADPTVAPELLRSLASITGIPPAQLLRAERRMLRTGSVQPLQELLSDPQLVRSERLRYRLCLEQARTAAGRPHATATTRFVLIVTTARGRIDVAVSFSARAAAGRSEAGRLEIAWRFAGPQGRSVVIQRLDVGHRAAAPHAPDVRTGATALKGKVAIAA
jgi:hypothetical protein